MMIPVLRPDTTIIWIPEKMASSLGIKGGEQLSKQQWNDSHLQALIHSRDVANENGRRCNERWHEENGFL